MNYNRFIQLTDDGSHTVAVPDKHITYHSRYGAIQESLHVFINAGLQYFIHQNKYLNKQSINIFEMGFGTGLNALLSLLQGIQFNQKIVYQTIDAYPLSIEEITQLNYTSLIDEDLQQYFSAMHICEWNERVEVHLLFSFKKMKTVLQQFQTQEKFHIIYFDAFDPDNQPELWTEIIFRKMFDMLFINGMLITYCSKGIVRRAMQAAGFTIEKLKGPPGKREIVRAIKTIET